MAVYQAKYKDKNGEWRSVATWSYEFWFGGERIQEPTRQTSKTVAKKMEADHKRRLEEGFTGVVKATPRQRIRSVGKILDQYEKDYAPNHTPKARAWVKDRGLHLRRILGDVLQCDLTETRMAEYMTARKAEALAKVKARAKENDETLDPEDLVNLGHRSINMELDCLARACGSQWRVLWPKLKKLTENQDVGRALSDDEVARLLVAADKIQKNPMAQKIVKLDLLAGFRFQEIANLTWSHVDFHKGLMRVGKSKTEAGRRSVGMNTTAREILTAQRDWWIETIGRSPKPNEYVWPWAKHYTGPFVPSKPIQSIKNSWKKIRELAGVEIRFHDLRHTVYSRLDALEIPEQVIMATMGHVSSRMRKRYSHATEAAQRAAMEGLVLPELPNRVPIVPPIVSHSTGSTAKLSLVKKRRLARV